MRYDTLTRTAFVDFPLQGFTVEITNGLDATFQGETVRLTIEQLGRLLAQSEHEHDLIAHGHGNTPTGVYTPQAMPDYAAAARLSATLADSKSKNKGAR